MKIYGIYNEKESEQCVRVGTLPEIVKFLNLTVREVGRALNKNNLVRHKYKIYYLFKEDTDDTRKFS
mgnify:FL=1